MKSSIQLFKKKLHWKGQSTVSEKISHVYQHDSKMAQEIEKHFKYMKEVK